MKQKIADNMSKKHFIKLADYIRELNGTPDQFTSQQLEQLAHWLASENSQFMKGRWLAYIRGECGKNGGQIKAK